MTVAGVMITPVIKIRNRVDPSLQEAVKKQAKITQNQDGCKR